MKRMYLVLVAMVLAVGFSAFTPDKASLETVYYNLEQGDGWESIENPCPAGELFPCTVTIGDNEDVQLYRTPDFSQPVLTDRQ